MRMRTARALVEIKAVGPDYPVIGEIATTPQGRRSGNCWRSVTVFSGAVADPVLAGSRLDLETGGTPEIRIGTSRFEIRAGAGNPSPTRWPRGSVSARAS